MISLCVHVFSSTSRQRHLSRSDILVMEWHRDVMETSWALSRIFNYLKGHGTMWLSLSVSSFFPLFPCAQFILLRQTFILLIRLMTGLNFIKPLLWSLSLLRPRNPPRNNLLSSEISRRFWRPTTNLLHNCIHIQTIQSVTSRHWLYNFVMIVRCYCRYSLSRNW